MKKNIKNRKGKEKEKNKSYFFYLRTNKYLGTQSKSFAEEIKI
jgi:hypothetical protein